MKNIAVVLKQIEDKVLVEIDRQEACASCNACKNDKKGKSHTILVQNNCSAVVGDIVEIEFESRYFLTAIVMTYILPFFALILGFFLAYFIKSKVEINISDDSFIFFFGIATMMLSFLIIGLYDRKINRDKFSPKMSRKIKAE